MISGAVVLSAIALLGGGGGWLIWRLFLRSLYPECTCIFCGSRKDQIMKAKVILFKRSGKYYTEEEWRVPADVPRESGDGRRPVLGPYDMEHSMDFRRIDGGAVLVETQVPWGYPFLIMPEE